jgi:hypothetical protein
MKKKTKTRDNSASSSQPQVGVELRPEQMHSVGGGWMDMNWGGGLYSIPNSWNDMYAPSSEWNGYYY